MLGDVVVVESGRTMGTNQNGQYIFCTLIRAATRIPTRVRRCRRKRILQAHLPGHHFPAQCFTVLFVILQRIFSYFYLQRITPVVSILGGKSKLHETAASLKDSRTCLGVHLKRSDNTIQRMHHSTQTQSILFTPRWLISLLQHCWYYGTGSMLNSDKKYREWASKLWMSGFIYFCLFSFCSRGMASVVLLSIGVFSISEIH